MNGNKRKFDHVAVLMGGDSSECEISMMSGKAVSDGLEEAGYTVSRVVLGNGNSFSIPDGVQAVFVALHGAFGEDGQVQKKLREMGLPYTGSGEKASQIGFDKVLSRREFARAGIRIPKGMHIDQAVADSPMKMRPPVVVKPARQGSSVGISVVHDESEFAKALSNAREFCPDVVVEQYIPGREWSVPILLKEVLPPVEITPKTGLYDWKAKYFSGGTTSYTFPEDNHQADLRIISEVSETAMRAFNAIGARSVARVDFRIDPSGTPYVLEINTIPGCTKTSILPKSAAKRGIPFSRLCAAIMEDAECG